MNTDLKSLNKTLFLLRTNLDWFRSSEDILLLEARMKHAVLLFDELCFEDGQYNLTVFENGSRDQFIPPSLLKEFDRRIVYSAEGKQGSVTIKTDSGSAYQLAGGKILFQSRVDFKPILEKYNLINKPFIKLQELASSKKIKLASKEFERRFRRQKIDKEYFKQNSLIKNLSYSCIQSHLFQAPFIASQSFHRILKEQARPIATEYKQDVLLRSLLSMRFPNFSNLSWDEIIDLRNEKAIVSLREKLLELATTESPIDKMKTEIINETLQDINKLKPSILRVSGNISLGILSFFPNLFGLLSGLIDLGLDVFELQQTVSSWSVILLTLDKYAKKEDS